MHVFPAPPPARTLELLAECGLPTRDLTEAHFPLFLGCGDEGLPDGVAGLELHGDDALLRSLAVARRHRGKGCGRALALGVEALARRHGAGRLYLLTETAQPFFHALGFRDVAREAVPATVRASEEFSSLCPASATVMMKVLAD